VPFGIVVVSTVTCIIGLHKTSRERCVSVLLPGVAIEYNHLVLQTDRGPVFQHRFAFFIAIYPRRLYIVFIPQRPTTKAAIRSEFVSETFCGHPSRTLSFFCGDSFFRQ
jgi:hypothetical protein